MALIQKNIWTIFYTLLLCGIGFLGIASYYKWNNVHEHYAEDQINLVKLVGNATHSLLLSQEMILDVLGKQVLRDQNPRMLDELLLINPSVVAFGFVDVEGNYRYINTKFDKAKLPNLRQNPLTQESFEYTLTQNTMVLGRTYYIAASGRWGIPIRKSILDDSGKVLGVMTAGLGIEGAFKIYTESLSLGDYNKVTLIRERDHFIQFQSANTEISKEIYENPLPEAFLNALMDTITHTYAVSKDEIKASERIYTASTRDVTGEEIQFALKYEPRYALWILSDIKETQIVREFIEHFFAYVMLFAIIHVVLFFLFKIISDAENKRRVDLLFQATHDSLTHLPNRAYFQQCIHDWMCESAPPFSLLYIDLDHFKNVNDSFGHHFGDLLLIEFSRRLLQVKSPESIDHSTRRRRVSSLKLRHGYA